MPVSEVMSLLMTASLEPPLIESSLVGGGGEGAGGGGEGEGGGGEGDAAGGGGGGDSAPSGAAAGGGEGAGGGGEGVGLTPPLPSSIHARFAASRMTPFLSSDASHHIMPPRPFERPYFALIAMDVVSS